MQIKDLQNMSANGWNAGFEEGMRKGYNKAIDDFAEAIKDDSHIGNFYCDDEVDEIAEQLKAGEQNDR